MRCRVRDVEFNYEERGDGIPLIALHGWPLDHRHLMVPLEPLFERRPGWRRIYPDMPGMGQTPGPDWVRSQDQMVELALAFIDAVVPGERFVLAGASYGGFLARGVVHEMGDRVDGVLFSVPAIEGCRQPQHVVRRADPAFEAAIRPGEEGARDMVVTQDVAVLESWRRAVLPALRLADNAFLERVGARWALSSFDPDHLPVPLRAPALFLHGRFEDWCGYEDGITFLADYPFATYAVLDGAGHSLAEEKPELFRALVDDWLDRVEYHRTCGGA